MSQTFIEALLDQCVALNTVVLPVNQSCDLTIISGPQRLAPISQAEMRALAQTALNGYSLKFVKRDAVDALDPLTVDKTLAPGATVRVIAFLVTIAGAANTFRRGPITLRITGDGATPYDVVVYPKDTRCQFLALTVSNNGNNGQITAALNPSVFYDASEHPGTIASEFVIAAETVNMRDFTPRS